ncbi:hypothetical protein M0R89_07475 [Halorussus limi]|uniref:Uncharacterized protein n=1 Tax=Halorussus limi TaxID=2938695 RepID=A0A8U0HYH3_9EURY|nr:hypothetical protein [Halorussus limi]UPV75889.1 hypothetical protein M0R89_07475 [Halorussus limi]
MQCPECGTAILGVATRGPNTHVFDPCGCSVPVHDIAALDRGRGLVTDGGEEQYGAATRFKANNADTETILLGRYDDATKLSVPEVHDCAPVRARRYYEPVTVVSFPYTMSREEAIEWLDDHRHHPDLADYDWSAHDQQDLLDVIVDNRSSYRMQLSDFERQLEGVRAVGERTKQELEEIREAMTDAMHNGPPVEVNCLDAPEEVDSA